MTAPMPQALPLIELVEPLARTFGAEAESRSTRSPSRSRTLGLSASRAHDTALDILGAYKLTGNFHINLEIVLKDLGVFDKVTYQIKPETLLPFRSDCRHVVFWPSGDLHRNRFGEIMRSITGRIGFNPTPPRWGRLFRRLIEATPINFRRQNQAAI